jgi:hypothetical protein
MSETGSGDNPELDGISFPAYTDRASIFEREIRRTMKMQGFGQKNI